MKFIKVLFCLVLISTNLYSQKVNKDSLLNIQPIRFINKINPFTIFWGSIFRTGEYKFNREVIIDKQHSWEFGFSYLDKNPVIGLFERILNPTTSGTRFYVKGFRTQLMTRFYPNLGIGKRPGTAPHGIYLAPHFSYSTAFISTSTLFKGGYHYRASNINVNLLCGLQFLVGKRLTVDLYGGIGIKQVSLKYTTPNYSKYIDPEDFFFFPGKLKLTLGFCFGIPIYRK
jgi:hypothetical protein